MDFDPAAGSDSILSPIMTNNTKSKFNLLFLDADDDYAKVETIKLKPKSETTGPDKTTPSALRQDADPFLFRQDLQTATAMPKSFIGAKQTTRESFQLAKSKTFAMDRASNI